MRPRRGNHEPPQDYAKSAYPHLDVGVAWVVDRVVKLREEDSRAEEHDPGEQRDHKPDDSHDLEAVIFLPRDAERQQEGDHGEGHEHNAGVLQPGDRAHSTP